MHDFLSKDMQEDLLNTYHIKQLLTKKPSEIKCWKYNPEHFPLFTVECPAKIKSCVLSFIFPAKKKKKKSSEASLALFVVCIICYDMVLSR